MLFDLELLEALENTTNAKQINFSPGTIEDATLSYVPTTPQIPNSEFYVKETSIKRINPNTSKVNSANRDMKITVCTFESKLHDSQDAKDYNQAMYHVHEQFIHWKRMQQFTECDLLLKQLNVEEFDLRILLSLLMASFQIKTRLSYRPLFYDKVYAVAQRSLSEDELLKIFPSLR